MGGHFPGLSGKATCKRRRPGEPLKVCIATPDIINPVTNGDTGTAYANLAAVLAAAGHEVTMVFLRQGRELEIDEKSVAAYHEQKGIRLQCLPKESYPIKANKFAAASCLAYRWLKERDFDVIHFPERMGLGYYSVLAKHQGLAFLNSTLVIGLHGPSAWSREEDLELLESVDSLEREFMERKSAAYADVVFSSTQYMISWALDHGWELPGRIYVQPCIVPDEFIRSVRPEFVKISEMVFLGRLEEPRGLALFCDALDIVSKRGGLRPVPVTFLGKRMMLNGRDSAEYIRDRARRWPLPIRILSGHDPHKSLDYLKQGGKLAIIPSFAANFTHTVNECCAMGIPFLACAVGGVPECVFPEDRERVCFLPRPAELADRIAGGLEKGAAPARPAVDFKSNRKIWTDWYEPPEEGEPQAGGRRSESGDESLSYPLVSVCLTTFNRPGLLAQALESLRRQDYPSFEVMLVDDGSDQPEAAAFLDRLEPEFTLRGWRIIRQENRYVGAARNSAARLARGEYLLFMDDDNYAEPHEISTFVKVALHTGADILTCMLKFFSGETAPLPNMQIPDSVFLPLGGAPDVGVLRNCFGDANSLVRRSTFQKLGGFAEDYAVGWDDYEFFARAVLQGARLETVPEELCWYREQEVSIHRTTALGSNVLLSARPYLRSLPPELHGIIHLLQGYHHLEIEGRLPAIQKQYGLLLDRVRQLESPIQKERAHAGSPACRIESDGADLPGSVAGVLLKLGKYLRRIASWSRYDAIYRIWKEARKKRSGRHEALQIIGDNYGVLPFFLLYPLYKTIKPLLKCRRFLAKKLTREYRGGLIRHFALPGSLGRRRKIEAATPPGFDPSKKTILLISHDASQTGAPIIALNLIEKFTSRYNVVCVLLGSGRLKNAFINASSAVIGPFHRELRYTDHIHEPIIKACREFEPAFAIVNSIESRQALVPLAEAGVPSVLLVHEFASTYPPHYRKTLIEAAGLASQVVFPSRLVWEDAVAAFPWLAARPANIITQGPCRLPREWLTTETADAERARIAGVMRPFGPEDNAVVVMGCGKADLRKGVDLFISVAAALRQRSPSRPFRFVWVGEYDEDISRYLNEQVQCCGFEDTVKFLGQVNSVDAAYAMSDIFLLSSRLDPFPNVAIDAMFAGLPVVCFSNCSGVAEFLSTHPDLGRLVVPYANASSAAEIIEQLSNGGPYAKTAKTAIRNLAQSALDMDRYFERLDRLGQRACLIMRQEETDLATISQSSIPSDWFAVPPDSGSPKNISMRQFVRETADFGGKRCPFPGFHPGIYRNAHPELNEPPFVNPLAHFIRSGQPQGPWLLDIIRPDTHPAAAVNRQSPPSALHLHIQSPDAALEILRSISKNGHRPDIFITMTGGNGLREVTQTAERLSLNIRDVAVVPCRGRGIGPLVTVLGSRLVRNYEIVGHLHTGQNSPVENARDGEPFRSFGMESLLGTEHNMLDIILDQFARLPKLGLVFPCAADLMGWTANRLLAIALLERMGIAADLPDELFYPPGAMFWARTEAIAPLLDLDLDWNDYPCEPVPPDGTILHAMERILPVVTRHRGFQMAGAYVNKPAR